MEEDIGIHLKPIDQDFHVMTDPHVVSGCNHPAQSALAKERRELQSQQQRTLLEAIPKDLSRPWEDPMPEEGERHLAMELRGIGVTGAYEVPEWKKQAEGGWE